ncbi:hypothetical protein BC828DRAFT_378731 [Blastocladiella britannica]|nr:hypothetical protein BC828DRAFT_378731 [Blastocladiella britannica]
MHLVRHVNKKGQVCSRAANTLKVPCISSQTAKKENQKKMGAWISNTEDPLTSFTATPLTAIGEKHVRRTPTTLRIKAAEGIWATGDHYITEADTDEPQYTLERIGDKLRVMHADTGKTVAYVVLMKYAMRKSAQYLVLPAHAVHTPLADMHSVAVMQVDVALGWYQFTMDVTSLVSGLAIHGVVHNSARSARFFHGPSVLQQEAKAELIAKSTWEFSWKLESIYRLQVAGGVDLAMTSVLVCIMNHVRVKIAGGRTDTLPALLGS